MLPVFQNLAYTDILVPVYLNKDELLHIAQSTAKSLSLEIVDYVYETVKQSNALPEVSLLTGAEICYLTAKTKTANTYVEGSGNAKKY